MNHNTKFILTSEETTAIEIHSLINEQRFSHRSTHFELFFFLIITRTRDATTHHHISVRQKCFKESFVSPQLVNSSLN